MTKVVSSGRRIVVMPLLVVNGHSHFGGVPIVQAVGTSEVLVAPVVLRVRHIGVVVKPIHVLRTLLAPVGSIGGLLSVGGRIDRWLRKRKRKSQQQINDGSWSFSSSMTVRQNALRMDGWYVDWVLR